MCIQTLDKHSECIFSNLMNFKSCVLRTRRSCKVDKQLRAVLNCAVTQVAKSKALYQRDGRGHWLCLPRSGRAVAEIPALSCCQS